MSATSLIDEQIALFRSIEERFEERITREGHEKRLRALSDEQEGRIKARIERLESEKAAAAARYDAAIAAERKALEEVRARRTEAGPQPPRPPRAPAGKPAARGKAAAKRPSGRAPRRKT